MPKGNRKKAALFVALTFAASWALAGLFYLLGGRWTSGVGIAAGVAFMFIPTIAAIVVQKKVYGQPILKPLGIRFRPNRWFAVGWLLPPALAFAAMGVGLLLPGVEYSPGMEGMFERYSHLLPPEALEQMREQTATMPVHPLVMGLALGLVAGLTANAVAGFGEELGWRGLLQRELRDLGFWRSSAIVGLIWGVWHAPLILQGHNYPQHPVAGVFVMIAWCVLLAPLFGLIRLKSRSVIAAAIMHGTLNGTAGLAMVMLKGGNDLLVGLTGAAGCTVLTLANVGLFVWDRFTGGRLLAPTEDAEEG